MKIVFYLFRTVDIVEPKSMLRKSMNTELDFRKTDFILALHQIKTFIYVLFMVGNTNIFSCKISESKNMFRNKLKNRFGL